MNVFDKIEELTETLKALQPLKPEYQQKLDKKFRLEFNYNSNHIEGNTLTYSETELLLIFDDTKGSHTLREYEEMKAHDVAYQMIKEWAKDKERPLTEQNIKNLNEVILVRPYWKEAITPDGQATRRQIKVGDYKEFPNSVRLQNGEIYEYTSPIDTPIEMQALMEWYRVEERALHPVTLAAMLHYKFVRIHPFDDGNGRIARLLMNYTLLRNGLPPVVIKSADKHEYIGALHIADVGEFEPFISYIAKQVVWSLELTIAATKGENIDEPDDLDKKLSLLEKDLEIIDANEEIKKLFSKEVFLEIYKTWATDLMKEVIPLIQKFNKFFTGTSHNVSVSNGIGYVKFINEPADEIISKLNSIVFEGIKQNFNTHDCIINLNTFYGTFIKGGLNTFGCNYGLQIRFDINKYEVFVDEFSETGQRNLVRVIERLLHKPLTKSDMENIANKLADTIYQHIDHTTKRNGIR